jgi:hypothetical protein
MDGQTDMTKLTVAFRHFANTSETSVITAGKISMFQTDLYRRQIYSFAATPQRLAYFSELAKKMNQLAFGTPLHKRTIATW